MRDERGAFLLKQLAVRIGVLLIVLFFGFSLTQFQNIPDNVVGWSFDSYVVACLIATGYHGFAPALLAIALPTILTRRTRHLRDAFLGAVVMLLHVALSHPFRGPVSIDALVTDVVLFAPFAILINTLAGIAAWAWLRWQKRWHPHPAPGASAGTSRRSP